MPLSTELTCLLGIELPVIEGGMQNVGFAELAAAVSNAGGFGMIMTGTDVQVAAQAVIILAYYHYDLAVGLQTDYAISDMHPCFLHSLRQTDIGGLVKTGLQLDDNGDLFAVMRGQNKGIDYTALAGGAIERHLDAAHFGVRRRLTQESLDRG